MTAAKLTQHGLDVDRLINRLSLDPNWLWPPVRRLARRGQLRDAQRLVALMEKTTGNATADSSVARNVELDQAYIDLAKAEINWPAGGLRAPSRLSEPTREVLKSRMLEPLAAVYTAAGRLPEAIGCYEELLRETPLGNELQQPWLESHVGLGRIARTAESFRRCTPCLFGARGAMERRRHRPRASRQPRANGWGGGGGGTRPTPAAPALSK